MYLAIKAGGNWWLCDATPDSGNRYRAVARLESEADMHALTAQLSPMIQVEPYDGPASISYVTEGKERRCYRSSSSSF